MNTVRDMLRVERADFPTRKPTTAVDLWVISVLERGGPAVFGELVKQIADQMYLEELRHGAAVIDIGLFGARLFHAQAAAILERGDGVWWTIGEWAANLERNSRRSWEGMALVKSSEN